ncbi:MAG: DNA-processing protein DprA, partial [Thermoanaerobaculia bacterium]
MNESENRDLLIAWALLPFLTPARTRLLLEYFDPIAKARDASIATLAALLNIDAVQAEQVKVPLRSASEVIARVRDHVVTLADAEYPPLLREIIDPPLALHVRGDRSLLQREAVSVVGSRRASPYALNAARRIVEPL